MWEKRKNSAPSVGRRRKKQLLQKRERCLVNVLIQWRQKRSLIFTATRQKGSQKIKVLGHNETFGESQMQGGSLEILPVSCHSTLSKLTANDLRAQEQKTVMLTGRDGESKKTGARRRGDMTAGRGSQSASQHQVDPPHPPHPPTGGLTGSRCTSTWKDWERDGLSAPFCRRQNRTAASGSEQEGNR